MATAVVLGGCGGIGSFAVRTLAAVPDVDRLVVADVRPEPAEAMVASLGHPGGRAAVVDVADPASLAAVLEGADVVVNCVGPFYRFGAPTLAAAIRAGVPYVDVCDDLDATIAQLELDGAARAAGVPAVIGIGNSPGLANVLVRFSADNLLEQVESVDIMHIHGGEPTEGGAVIKHRIHAMTNDVPLFIDGEFVSVRMLEPSGKAFVEETEFRGVGRFPVYPYPHPETITLPRHLPGLRRATNLGVVYPLTYFERTMELVREGLTPDEIVERLLVERPGFLADAGLDGPGGCLKVVVGGTSAGERHTYVFSLTSQGAGAGEGTGIPAGLAAISVLRGAVTEPGVHPPEAVLDPNALLTLAGELLPSLGVGGSEGGGAVPIHIEHVLPDGSSETLDLAL